MLTNPPLLLAEDSCSSIQSANSSTRGKTELANHRVKRAYDPPTTVQEAGSLLIRAGELAKLAFQASEPYREKYIYLKLNKNTTLEQMSSTNCSYTGKNRNR